MDLDSRSIVAWRFFITFAWGSAMERDPIKTDPRWASGGLADRRATPRRRYWCLAGPGVWAADPGRSVGLPRPCSWMAMRRLCGPITRAIDRRYRGPYFRRFSIGSQTSHYWGPGLPASQLRREKQE